MNVSTDRAPDALTRPHYTTPPGRLHFTYTTDAALVKSILSEPRCFRRMNNDPVSLATINAMDTLPTRLLFAVPSVRKNALFVMSSLAPGVSEVHFCVTPSAWGQAEYIVNEFLGWIWRTTSIKRLVGPVPSHNRLALRIARQTGFRHVETKPAAAAKDGKQYDLLVMEISRAA